MYNSLYLKYRQDRINARLLADLNKHNWLINKVSKKNTESLANGSKSPPKTNESLRVSLPIDIFNNLRKSAKKPVPALENMSDEKMKFKIPRSLPNRAKVSTPYLVAALHNTTGRTAPGPVFLGNGLPAGNRTSKPSIVLESNKLVCTSNGTKKTDSNVTKGTVNALGSTIVNPLDNEPNISLKHRLPITAMPTKGSYNTASRLNNAAIELNKEGTKTRINASAQTDKVFIYTEDKFNILGIITRSGLTEEELKKALDRYLEKDDENNNVNQEMMNMALRLSQNNKKLLLSKMEHFNNSNISQSSEVPRPTRASTPFPFTISPHASQPPPATNPHVDALPPPDPVAVNQVEALRQMAFDIIASTNSLKTDNTEINKKNQTKQPETSNEKSTDMEQHYNNSRKLATMMSQQTQYGPQAMLVQRNGHLKQQLLHLPHQQQSYLQQQQLRQQQLQQQQLQQQQLQQQQMQHQQLQQPQMQQHHSSQYYSPIQLFQIQADQSLYQQPHSEEQQASQNEILYGQQQQHFVPQQPQQHFNYAPAANNYRNQTKQITSKTTKQSNHKQLFPGDPRCQPLQSQLTGAPNQHERVMSTYEANMRSASAQHNRQQMQYQQYYQNQYFQN